MLEILKAKFEDNIANIIFRFCCHPTAEIIRKNILIQQILTYYMCDNVILNLPKIFNNKVESDFFKFIFFKYGFLLNEIIPSPEIIKLMVIKDTEYFIFKKKYTPIKKIITDVIKKPDEDEIKLLLRSIFYK
jgi:hypothetical protein